MRSFAAMRAGMLALVVVVTSCGQSPRGELGLVRVTPDVLELGTDTLVQVYGLNVCPQSFVFFGSTEVTSLSSGWSPEKVVLHVMPDSRIASLVDEPEPCTFTKETTVTVDCRGKQPAGGIYRGDPVASIPLVYGRQRVLTPVFHPAAAPTSALANVRVSVEGERLTSPDPQAIVIDGVPGETFPQDGSLYFRPLAPMPAGPHVVRVASGPSGVRAPDRACISEEAAQATIVVREEETPTFRAEIVRDGVRLHVVADDVGAVAYQLERAAPGSDEWGGIGGAGSEPSFDGPNEALLGCFRVRARLIVETLVSAPTCFPGR